MPLEIAGCRDQAAVSFECVPEHWLFGNRLGSGIERCREFLQGFLPPPGNQPPAHRHQEQALFTGNDDAGRISRAKIVIRAEIWRGLSEPVKLDEFRPSEFLCKSSTHLIPHITSGLLIDCRANPRSGPV